MLRAKANPHSIGRQGKPTGHKPQAARQGGSGTDFGTVGDSEPFGHFGVEEAAAGAVGLDPLAINDELRDGAFADVSEDFFGGAGGCLDVDFGERNAVGIEEAFGLSAITAPGS
jgi:hypothetical protein